MTEQAPAAFWLPGWERVPTRPLTIGAVTVLAPDLTPADLTRLSAELRVARTQVLQHRTTADVLAVLAAVARRWQDRHHPLRRMAEAFIPGLTGYAPAMVAAGLTAMVQRAGPDALAAVLASELPDPAVLDGFVPLPGGGVTRAAGPELIGFVFSGNVPGIPAYHLALGLLARSAAIAKSALGEPLFPALWCRAVHEVDPDLGRCLACAYWPGERAELHQAAFQAAGAVVAFGADAALADLARLLPAGCRYLPYGTRLGFGVIAREALTPSGLPDLGWRAARDVAQYDQQGCVSPHVFFVEEGGTVAPAAFAALLAESLGRLQAAWPRSELPAAAAAAIQAARSEYRFRPDARLWVSPGSTDWTVALAPAEPLTPGPLNRFVRVCPVPDLNQVPDWVASWRGRLQTCACAGPVERLQELATSLAPLGVSRLCPLGRAQEPAPAWHHDGGPNLLPLLRWIDVEPEGPGREG